MEFIEKINEKLENLKKYLDFLKSNADIEKETLEDNYTLRSAIERNFQLAIESILDIGEIIISEENLKKPEEYRDIIETLGKNSILPTKFAKKFAPVAGFRNILVHRYNDIDVDELHEHLKKDLADFDIFIANVIGYIKQKQH